MGKENYDFGKSKLTSTITAITVPLAGGQILPGAAGRVGVRFSAPTTNRCTISDKPGVVLDSGYNAYPAAASGPEFCMAIQGTITEKAFYGIAAVADQVIAVVETFRHD